MKYKFLMVFIICAFEAKAQDSLITDSQTVNRFNASLFKSIKAGDTIIVNIKNEGCRVTNGDHFLLFKIDTSLKMIRIRDFNSPLILDGKVLIEKEKEEFYVTLIQHQPNSSVKVQVINQDSMESFIDKIASIFESENDEGLKIAGNYTYLSIRLNERNYEGEFKRWIEFD